MTFLKKFGKALVSLVAGVTTSLLGCIGIRRNYKVIRQTHDLAGDRLQCDRGWWDKLNKQRYGATMQYVMLSTFGAITILILGTSEGIYCGPGRITIYYTSLYGCLAGFMFYISPDLFHSWLNDLNNYFLCGRNKDWKDYFGNTKLHRAIYRQDIGDVEKFLIEGSCLTIQNEQNEDNPETSTPLVLAEECIDAAQMNRELAERIHKLISEAVKTEIISRWKNHTRERSLLLRQYSNNNLSLNTATIVSNYLFNENVAHQIPMFVNRNPALQRLVFKGGKNLILFEIKKMEKQELQNKNRDAVLAIDVNHESDAKPKISSNGYALLS